MTGIIRIDFDGIIIDYKVDYNITGKVFNSHPLIFDLPPNGQKLILGNNQEEIRNHIKVFQNLIPIILPIGIQNQDTFLSNGLNTIYNSINAQLKETGIDLNTLYQIAEENSLAYYVHASYSNPNDFPKDFHKIWTSKMGLINDRYADIKAGDLRFLGYHYPQFGFKIIPLIIPFIKQSSIKKIAYEMLAKVITKESYNYLKEELQTCKDGQALGGIFIALSKHQLKDVTIQQTLIDIYNSDIQLDEDAKAKLMEALKHYPNHETAKIGIELLSGQNLHTSEQTSKILLSMGYSAKKIADLMLPRLQSTDSKESQIAFSILSSSDKFKRYLPNNNKLLNLFARALEVNQNLKIASSMPDLIQYQYNTATSLQIVRFLSIHHPVIIKGFLLLIKKLLDDSRFNTKPFYSKKAKKIFIDLLNKEELYIVEKAFDILKIIGKNEKNRKFIDLFLKHLDLNKNSYKNLYAMKAINHILPVVKFNNRIINPYKVALESEDYNYRATALRGLRYSNDHSLKRSLDYFKDDPSSSVRAAANILFEEPKKAYKSSLWSRLKTYAYILFKYKGRVPTQKEFVKDYFEKEFGWIKPENKAKKYKVK